MSEPSGKNEPSQPSQPSEQSEHRRYNNIFDLLDAIIIKIRTAKPQDKDVSIGYLKNQLSDNAIAFLLMLISFPLCIPFIYLIPQIVSIPIIYLIFKMAMGKTSIWLPNFIAKRKLNIDELEKSFNFIKKYFHWIVLFTHRRLTFMNQGKFTKILAFLMLIPAVSILIPLPLTNSVPGLSVALFSVFHIMNDGLLKLVSVIMGIAWVIGLLFFGISVFDIVVNYISK